MSKHWKNLALLLVVVVLAGLVSAVGYASATTSGVQCPAPHPSHTCTPKPCPTVTVTCTPQPGPTVTVTATATTVPEPAPTVTETATPQPVAPLPKPKCPADFHWLMTSCPPSHCVLITKGSSVVPLKVKYPHAIWVKVSKSFFGKMRFRIHNRWYVVPVNGKSFKLKGQITGFKFNYHSGPVELDIYLHNPAK